MKCAVISLFLVIFAFALQLQTTNANINQDFNEIGNLIPKTKLVLIIGKHLFDGELKNFRKFAQSQEFAKLWERLIKNQKFRNIIKYVQDSGVDAIGGLNQLANLLHLNKYQRTSISTKMLTIQSRSVMSFIDDVLRALPQDKLKQLMRNKMKTSVEFKKFHDRLAAPEFHQLIMTFRAAPDLAGDIKILEQKGLNVEKLLKAAKDILHWAD